MPENAVYQYPVIVDQYQKRLENDTEVYPRASEASRIVTIAKAPAKCPRDRANCLFMAKPLSGEAHPHAPVEREGI